MFKDIQVSSVFQAPSSSVNTLVLVVEGEEDKGRDLSTRDYIVRTQEGTALQKITYRPETGPK